MSFDIRLPIGILFTVLGLLLAVQGLASDPSSYARALGVNVNLYWGGVILVFGVVMLVFALSTKRKPSGRADSGPAAGSW